MKQSLVDKDFWATLVPELSVRDLDASRFFYCDIIGFSIKYERSEENFAYIELGKSQMMLEQIPEDPSDMWNTGALEFPLGRGINFQIEVDNISALSNRITTANIEFFSPMSEAWYRVGDYETGQRQFLVQDPDGYLLRFMQHLGEREFNDANSRAD